MNKAAPRSAVALVVGAVALAAALFNLAGEYAGHRLRVARSQQEAGLPFDDSLAFNDGLNRILRPQGRLLRALLRTTAASETGLDSSQGVILLEYARGDLKDVMQARPHWAEAEVAGSYLAMLTEEALHPESIRLLSDSYSHAGYLREAAPWRIRYGATVWDALPQSTRQRVVAEDLWFARTNAHAYAYAHMLVAGTPAEQAVQAAERGGV